MSAIYETQYGKIFLDPLDSSQPSFPRKIHHSEISTSTYVRNRDEYLAHYLIERIGEEFSNVLERNCQEQQRQDRRMFYLRYHYPGLTTWATGNATFATPAGEILFLYDCKIVQVHAVEDESCYTSLKVELEPGQRLAVELHPPGTDLFMEPLTRRLTRVGVRIPCTPRLTPKYKNVQGGWTSVGHDLQPARDPEPHTHPDDVPTPLDDFHPDFSMGGLYSPAELRQLEYQLDFSRVTTALLTVMVRQGDSLLDPASYIGPQDIFPEPPSPIWLSLAFGSFLFAIRSFGIILSGILLTHYILQTGRSIATWVVEFAALRQMVGCTFQLCWSFCPQSFLLRQHYRDLRRSRSCYQPDLLPGIDPIPQGVSSKARSVHLQLQELQIRLNQLQHIRQGSPPPPPSSLIVIQPT